MTRSLQNLKKYTDLLMKMKHGISQPSNEKLELHWDSWDNQSKSSKSKTISNNIKTSYYRDESPKHENR